MAELRLLIAEDHPVVREGLRALLEYRDGLTVCAVAANGRETVARYREFRPDVTLMDLQMPEVDGIQAMREIVAFDADARIVVLTTYSGAEDVRRSVAAGARGFLLKDCDPAELYRAIETVALGGKYLCTEAREVIAENEGRAVLSPRESEVLRLLARSLSNKAIGNSLFLSEATVRTHVGHIFTKLGVSDRLEAVRVATERGLLRF